MEMGRPGACVRDFENISFRAKVVKDKTGKLQKYGSQTLKAGEVNGSSDYHVVDTQCLLVD